MRSIPAPRGGSGDDRSMSESKCRVVGCSSSADSAWPKGTDGATWVQVCRPHLEVLAVDQRSSLMADGSLVLGAVS